ncbi:Bile acid 7-dehydroxylase 2 [Ephemeroptericola cinctiostellae]|uniref:Bile acid 7-dehydroxylase 2 n=1 Tax=Ephemeroptericola cinctiostellae TaxID=2268024 RepID=A0A345DB10_9BURK|nr:SDR family NAD(P)-dependent oxidoreductase [Ephemeroptericola cinctiostellae]AXF85548.1 Bile acid 7-dehydroxylase 2 [Ephemeroptericola cinctiostellae]
MQLKGKTILITGGASGIGLEAVKQFLANGAQVIITGRNQSKLDAAKKMYPGITAINSDVAKAEDVQTLLKQVQAMGGIDILYNNAGVVSQPKNLGITNAAHAEAAEYEMDINYLGIIRMNNAFMDMLKSKPESAIINTSSILSYQPFNLSPTYAASKAAVRFYTESLRNHLKIIDGSVKVFELLPPLVATDMAEGMPAKAISPETLVNHLISGLKKNQYVIRVGDTKVIYFLSRFFPKMAHKILNSAQTDPMLRA